MPELYYKWRGSGTVGTGAKISHLLNYKLVLVLLVIVVVVVIVIPIFVDKNNDRELYFSFSSPFSLSYSLSLSLSTNMGTTMTTSTTKRMGTRTSYRTNWGKVGLLIRHINIDPSIQLTTDWGSIGRDWPSAAKALDTNVISAYSASHKVGTDCTRSRLGQSLVVFW